MSGLDAGRRALNKKTLKAFVLEASNHTAYCNPLRLGWQWWGCRITPLLMALLPRPRPWRGGGRYGKCAALPYFFQAEASRRWQHPCCWKATVLFNSGNEQTRVRLEWNWDKQKWLSFGMPDHRHVGPQRSCGWSPGFKSMHPVVRHPGRNNSGDPACRMTWF